MKTRAFLCTLTLSLLIFGCSKSLDQNQENQSKSIQYTYSSMDTSDYHRLNGSIIGGIDVTNTAPKFFTKLYGVKNSVPESFIYNVERNALFGIKNGDTVVTRNLKVSSDSLFLNNYDNPLVYAGTYINGKELEIIYSYYAKLRVRREYKTQYFDSETQRLGMLTESDLINPSVNSNGSYFSSRNDMKDSLDMVTWLNVKIKYTVE